MYCNHILEYRRHFITFYYVDNFNIDLFDLSNCTFYDTKFTFRIFYCLFSIFSVAYVQQVFHDTFNYFDIVYYHMHSTYYRVCFIKSFSFFLLINIKYSNLMLYTNFTLIFNLLYEWHA